MINVLKSKITMFIGIFGLLGLTVGIAVGQDEQVPGDDIQWCQYFDEPDNTDIDGCQILTFNMLCMCE